MVGIEGIPISNVLGTKNQPDHVKIIYTYALVLYLQCRLHAIIYVASV